MSDIRDNSPEQVAYKLMIDIFNADNKGSDERSRDYILDTYAECFDAVRGNRKFEKEETEKKKQIYKHGY